MTLSDLKKASVTRQQEQETAPSQQRVAEVAALPSEHSTARNTSSDGRTKMLGARVPLATHREFQQQIFRAQEDYPNLTMQEAVPALIRLLRDEQIWVKFLAELDPT